MLDMFLSFLLVVAFLVATSGLISALISGRSPIHAVARRIRIAQVARRATADLDRQYELLLRS